MVINKKIKRTMAESKAQYLGSIALIIISCMLYSMFSQLADNMKNLTASFEAKYLQEDANFITNKKLANIPELESKFNVSIEETRTVDYAVAEGKTLRLFSQNTKVDVPAIIAGSKLRGGDILVDPAYAQANKLKIGDSIKIRGKSFTIAGFMSLPNYIYPLKEESDILNDPDSFGIGVISKEDFNASIQGNSFYAIRFAHGQNDLAAQMDQIKDALKIEKVIILKWTNASENPRITYVGAKVEGIDKMSASLPVIILLLTCILTGIVMWRMLKREFMIIGTLYALGYRKQEIMRHYLAYPLIIAVLGGVIGTSLGAFTLRPMLTVMVSYFNIPVDSVIFSIKYIVISLLLPVVFLGISGCFVINKALKYSPLELMRGGREKNRITFLERKLKLDKLSFSTKFKLREQLRSIPRSTFLFLGVTVATMLLLMGFAMQSSMDLLLKETYENTYRYNYMYVFNSLQQGVPANGEPFTEIPFTLKSNVKATFTLFGISPNSQLINLKDKTGKKLSPEQTVITRPLADKLKVKQGDTIHAVSKLDAREYSIKIDSISETYVGAYIYMPLAKSNAMLQIPPDSYAGLWSKDKLNIPESKLYAAVTVEDIKQAFKKMTTPIQTYVGAIAFISFIIGLIVIYVVTSLIIEENKLNISLMRVFGYRKKEVYSLILNSSSFLVVAGYLLGVPLLLVSLNALYRSITASMNFTLPITINYSYMLVGFVIIYFTYELSKFMSRRKVNRISMTEALKTSME